MMDKDTQAPPMESLHPSWQAYIRKLRRERDRYRREAKECCGRGEDQKAKPTK